MALERLDPRQHRGMHVVDHYGRYAFVAKHVRGLRVLDVACGPGYGSHLMAMAGAASVVGIDVSEEAVSYARDHYAHENVRYIVGDAMRLPELCAKPFDMIVSFETIEHINDPGRFIQACRAVASERGAMICSVPNEAELPHDNPYHLHHFDRESFGALLAPHWPIAKILDLRMSLATAIRAAAMYDNSPVTETLARVAVVESGQLRPDGFVALCGISEAPGPVEEFVIHSPQAFHDKEADLAWLESQRLSWMHSAENTNSAWRVLAEERDRVLKDQEEVNRAHEKVIQELEVKMRRLSEQFRNANTQLSQVQHATSSVSAFIGWKLRGAMRRLMPFESRRGQFARRMLRWVWPRPAHEGQA